MLCARDTKVKAFMFPSLSSKKKDITLEIKYLKTVLSDFEDVCFSGR